MNAPPAASAISTAIRGSALPAVATPSAMIADSLGTSGIRASSAGRAAATAYDAGDETSSAVRPINCVPGGPGHRAGDQHGRGREWSMPPSVVLATPVRGVRWNWPSTQAGERADPAPVAWRPGGDGEGPGSTQNSLPSGSRMTVWLGSRRSTTAPSASSLVTSAATAPGARRSKCMRFLAVLGSGTRMNQMFGPPQPAASTNALSAVDSSSTSDPKAAAQNVASASASVASNETDLITEGTPARLTGARQAVTRISRGTLHWRDDHPGAGARPGVRIHRGRGPRAAGRPRPDPGRPPARGAGGRRAGERPDRRRDPPQRRRLATGPP